MKNPNIFQSTCQTFCKSKKQKTKKSSAKNNYENYEKVLLSSLYSSIRLLLLQ